MKIMRKIDIYAKTWRLRRYTPYKKIAFQCVCACVCLRKSAYVCVLGYGERNGRVKSEGRSERKE